MARLNYHHLLYFWHVATDGNLTRVARKLHVSQSALSSQIRKLEESTGTKLLERSGRSLQLTETGRRVLAYANEIFTKGEELESLLLHGIEPERQLLRIGMLSTLSRNFIENFITPLLADGNVRFSLQSGSLPELLDGLGRHQLDVALTNSSVQGSEAQVWQSQLLARQPVSVFGPPEQPYPAFPEGYRDQRWVLPNPRSEVRAAFDAFCTLWQLEPDIHAETNDMAMLRLLARDSGALAVLPRVVVRDEIQQGTLAEYMALPNVYEDFYAITVRRHYMPAGLQQLLARFTPAEETETGQTGLPVA
ncbi:MAG: LysR family transcriptional regulator [Pseudomonadales bacterium]|jgi:LysR family transcriptional activator of nhaA